MYFSIYELSVDKINHIYVEIEIDIFLQAHQFENVVCKIAALMWKYQTNHEGYNSEILGVDEHIRTFMPEAGISYLDNFE